MYGPSKGELKFIFGMAMVGIVVGAIAAVAALIGLVWFFANHITIT